MSICMCLLCVYTCAGVVYAQPPRGLLHVNVFMLVMYTCPGVVYEQPPGGVSHVNTSRRTQPSGVPRHRTACQLSRLRRTVQVQAWYADESAAEVRGLVERESHRTTDTEIQSGRDQRNVKAEF